MLKKVIRNARKPMGFFGNVMIKRMNNGHAPMTQWALSQAEIGENDIILDIGCGGGKAVAAMAKRAGKVYGIDYSPLCVQEAKKENSEAMQAGKAVILEASVSHLPFADNTFDLVTGIETIYFWPNLETDMREALRVLKPGGKLMIICEMFRKEDGEQGRYQEMVEMLQMYYPTIRELEALFCRAGFSSVQVALEKTQEWICVTGTK